MLTQQTLTQLRFLKLSAMAETYQRQLEQPGLATRAFDERFGMMVEAEISARETRKLKRLVTMSKLPDFSLLEDTDYRADRGLDSALIERLATGEWVQRNNNVLVLGPTGTGKTWLGCALAGQMCRLGHSVQYLSAGDLFDALKIALSDGSWTKLKRRLIQVKILMIDDFGLAPIPPEVAHVLLDIVDKRGKTGSLIITSQYPIGKWHGFFPDPTVADAVLDRIVHRSHDIHLKGDSMRKIAGKTGNR